MRFGLPRSSSPSPVRGERTRSKLKSPKTPSSPKNKVASTNVSVSSFQRSVHKERLRPTYRRGTSFGLRDTSSESSSTSDSSSEDDDFGSRKLSAKLYPKEYSSSSEDESDEFGDVRRSSSDSEPSFDFRVSVDLNGQRLARVKKSKDKGKSRRESFTMNPAYPLQLSTSRKVSKPDEKVDREVEETVASIRLRTRFRDPYEEWEKSTRKEAFRSARKNLSSTQHSLSTSQQRFAEQFNKSLVSQHTSQLAEVQSQLESLKLNQENEESTLRAEWKKRETELWDRIERAIRLEEEKVKKKLEEERRKREEEERAKKEEEERKRQAEENARKEREVKEEEERKAKEEEERKKQELEEEVRRIEEALKKQEEDERLVSQMREVLGYKTPLGEWKEARKSLLELKDNVMSAVKGNKEAKKMWSAVRRQITPKVGQLTNDEDSINKISTQLHALLLPTPPHQPLIFAALCSSLAKAILLQAETEVTAEKKAAGPLARVLFNLLTTLDRDRAVSLQSAGMSNATDEGVFKKVFWAKLVQRTGGWVIPSPIVPETDVDGRKWGEGPKGRGRGRGADQATNGLDKAGAEKRTVLGYRKGDTGDWETPSEYTTRIEGMVRVFWEVVKVGFRSPGQMGEGDAGMVNLGVQRFWVWFARMAGVRPLLETGVGAELMHTALDVMGAEAADIWGWQWVKVLQLMYEGATNGLYPERGQLPSAPAKDAKSGSENVQIGGKTPEGRAARARVQIEVERIVRGEKKV